EPHRRYASARELADDLRRFRDRRPVVARPVGRPGRAWRWARRNPRDAALAALAVLLLLVALGGAWWLDRRQTEEASQLRQGRQRVEEALGQLPTLRREFLWEDAGALLTRAEREADALGLHDLGPALRQAGSDLHAARRLDELR